MRLSVLMAVYFKEKPENLFEAMESIWDKQTLKPDEIVLVEDGSLTNELDEIISFWKKKIGSAFRIIKLKKNEGLTKALNVGIKRCSGEYIARMDSDDLSAPNRFEIQLDFLKKNKDVHVVGGAIREFSSFNEEISLRFFPKSNEEIQKYIFKASPFAHGAVICRRSIFDEGLKYSEKYRTSQDIALWFDLLKKGYRLANIDDVIYFVRIDENFASRRSKEKSFNEFEIYWNGIRSLHGYSWKLIYPLMRFGFRLLPNEMVKKLYSSSLRKKFLN